MHNELTHLNGKQPLLKLLNTPVFDKSACCVKRCVCYTVVTLFFFLSSLLHHLYSGCCFCMLYPVYYVGVKKCLGGSDCLSDTKPCVFTYCGNPQLQLLQCKTKLPNSHHLFQDILILWSVDLPLLVFWRTSIIRSWVVFSKVYIMKIEYRAKCRRCSVSSWQCGVFVCWWDVYMCLMSLSLQTSAHLQAFSENESHEIAQAHTVVIIIIMWIL